MANFRFTSQLVMSLVLVFGPATTSWAVQAKGLYQASARVSSQKEADRAAGLKKAMGQVIVKITGRPALARAPELAALRNAAASYVTQFRYRRELQADGSRQLRIAAAFDSRRVNAEIRKSGVAIWPKERPQAVVWILEKRNNAIRLAGDADSKYSAWVRKAARSRALPVTMPVLDLEEQQKLDATTLWAGSDDPIIAASERYQADVIVVGRASKQNGSWAVKWRIHNQGVFDNWSTATKTVALGIEETMNRLTNRLASGERVTPAVQQTLAAGAAMQMVVRGIASVRHFAQVVTHLERFSVVQSVTVREMQHEQLSLELQLKGSMSQLERSIKLGRKLVVDTEQQSTWGATQNPHQPYQSTYQPTPVTAFTNEKSDVHYYRWTH